MIYQFAKGFHLKGVSAQDVGETLAFIERQHGQISAETVLDYARAQNSPLHPAFEWNDESAAEEYRLIQARYLVRAVVMVREEVEAPPTRAFVHVELEGQPTYLKTETVMGNDELRRQLLNRALEEATAWRRRYIDLHELADVFDVIERRKEALGDD